MWESFLNSSCSDPETDVQDARLLVYTISMNHPFHLPIFLILSAFAWNTPAFAEKGDEKVPNDWGCPQSTESDDSTEISTSDIGPGEDVLPCSDMDTRFGSLCQNAQILILSHEGITFCRIVFPEISQDPYPLYESQPSPPSTSQFQSIPIAMASSTEDLVPPIPQARPMWSLDPYLESIFSQKTYAKPG